MRTTLLLYGGGLVLLVGLGTLALTVPELASETEVRVAERLVGGARLRALLVSNILAANQIRAAGIASRTKLRQLFDDHAADRIDASTLEQEAAPILLDAMKSDVGGSLLGPLQSIAIADSRGVIRATTSPALLGADRSGSRAFQRGLGEFFHSGWAKGEETPSIEVAYPMLTATGQNLVVFLKSGVSPIFGALPSPQRSIVAFRSLIGDANTQSKPIFTWLGDENEALPSPSLEPGSALRRALGGEATEERLVSSAGEPWLLAYMPVEGSSGWAVGVAVPEVEALAPVQTALWRGAAGVAGPGLLAILVALLLSVKLARPIADLVVRTEELAAEEFDTTGARAREITFPREMQALDHAVERMAGHLRETGAERERTLANERSARQAAENANRARENFLAIVTHELRTPMTAIRGWVDELRDGQVPATEMPQVLDTLDHAIRTEQQLLDDLLDAARLRVGTLPLDLQRLDAADAVAQAVAEVRLVADRKPVVIVRTLESAWINADRVRLVQITSNLLANALSFTPAGGEIRIHLGRERGRVLLTVEDGGPGIPPELLGCVFEPFWQGEDALTRRHGGLGIGLTIARGLVEALGGTILVENAGGGRGARLTVSLPEAAAVTPPSSGATTPSPAATTSLRPLAGLRILLVEDEPANLALTVRLLERKGALVVATASAAEALEASSFARPDLVVSDIGLPEKDGYQLLAELRERWRDEGIAAPPALALTAYARPEDRARALSVGFAAWVSKPFRPSELVSTLAGLSEHAAA